MKLVCVGLLVIMFCEDKSPPIVTDSFCQRAKIIRLQEKTIDNMDRRELNQILSHNEKVKRCRKGN